MDQLGIGSVKASRTQAKRAVNAAIRRLKSAINLQMLSIGETAKHLEAVYGDFVEADSEFVDYCEEENISPGEAIVNGLDPKAYAAEVEDAFRGAISAYHSYVAVNSDATPEVARDAPRICLKKRDVPKFSGTRKEWPEFKALWESVVVPAISDKIALAAELKLSCRGGAAYVEIESVAITSSESYDIMWKNLCLHYDNVTLSVASALDEMKCFRAVEEEDYQGTIKLIRQVESVYQQLHVLKQVELVSSREINLMVSYLPPLTRKNWAEFYAKLDTERQLRPFTPLHEFLQEQMVIAKHMCDTQYFVKQHKHTPQHTPQHKPRNSTQHTARSAYSTNTDTIGRNQRATCCLHDTTKHTTELCRQFAGLSVQGRRDALQKSGRCFRCFGPHRRARCKEESPCGSCGRASHHTMMCFGNSEGSNAISNSSATTSSQAVAESHSAVVQSVSTETNAVHGGCVTLYAIYETPIVSSQQKAVIFCDDGSDTSFISKEGVTKLHARRLRPIEVEIVTLSGTETHSTFLYEVVVVTVKGKKVPVIAIGLPKLTGKVSPLDGTFLGTIFPDFDQSALQRPNRPVDILLGGDYFGLHPKHEVASDGKNLSVMQGELGVCVQGSHPDLKEDTKKDYKVGYTVRVVSHHATTAKISHPEFEPDQMYSPYGGKSVTSPFSGDVCSTAPGSVSDSADSAQHNENEDKAAFVVSHYQKESDGLKCETVAVVSSMRTHSFQVPEPEGFILGEDLGTEVTPRCGGCKCGKCPIVGHTYSFKEEQELEMINSNLRYDSDNARWVTSYPWTTDPQNLPDNYVAAMATLRNTERRLTKDLEWASKYTEQIHDMESRGVARLLSVEEAEAWKGPVFYLSHLAVENPKSLTTPVRIVFNSSQVFRGVSLNSFLAKGPDSFRTNLLGLLLRFRENPVVLVGDIRKMYNSVFLEELEQHTHRFLWRDMNGDKRPDVWCITRVNMGDKPAGAIAIEAKDRTADQFSHLNPAAASFIKGSSYVDDLVDSVSNLKTAQDIAEGTDEILLKGGFSVKAWDFGGRDVPGASSEAKKVLGVLWIASLDILLFEAQLNFSSKQRNVRTGPNLSAAQVPECLPPKFTRRMVLQQVMGVFDPFGFLAPFMLHAKIFLRETWTHQLQWDEELPADLDKNWRWFFTALLSINDLRYDRCVTPEGTVGNPELVILSDGSETAYGCAAYIRWTLKDGKFWCRLLLAKSRIAPLSRASVPQMELNGAVLSKRCRKVIETECRFSFDRVYHLVDSETVLGMIHKLSTRFKVYEGVRVGEIQAATAGDMSCWGWVQGDQNIADWVTRPRSPSEIGPESEWFLGPEFLYLPFEEWGVKFRPSQVSMLPGEKKVAVHAIEGKSKTPVELSCSRSSSLRVVKWVFARILSMLRSRSFKGGRRANVTPELLDDAEKLLIADAQQGWTQKTTMNRYRTLQPVVQDGVWVVGTRISHQSPLTPENKPQILLPPDHPVTGLFMRDAHISGGHRGRDGTVARFRARYWTSHATKLSKSICGKCQLCKLLRVKLMDQMMGQMPPARLMPAPPFSKVMLDLFGPYLVRGEVQKRTSGKAWGVIFTDLCCRAIHVEVAFGYDTESFLLALSRFTAIRGWPSLMYSDPGSQLVGASAELKQSWKNIDKDKVIQVSANAGMEWRFGPADSPWYQGAAEALIRSVKRGIDLSVRGQRLSVPEMLTVFTEVANLVNERPLGVKPSADSEISILTPNCLLLGRTESKNPGGYGRNMSLLSRLTLIRSITDQFWKHWTSLYAPALVHQSKWLLENRELKVDDVVLVADQGILRGQYRLARVTQVLRSADGLVRRVRVSYKRYKIGERICDYHGASDVEVERSVQRLSLLVPVEDQK